MVRAQWIFDQGRQSSQGCLSTTPKWGGLDGIGGAFMSVSKTMPIVGQTEWTFASPCKKSTCGDNSVSRVLANLAQQVSTLVSPATRSTTPKSGKSGHIWTLPSCSDDWKSLEKCNFQLEEPPLRTQSGHFRLRRKDVELSFRGSHQAHGEAHDQAYDEAYDRA